MFSLPTDYIQRSNRNFKSSKPTPDMGSRNYIYHLTKRLSENGYKTFISGIDSILHLLDKLGDCPTYMDYGYQVEIAKNFSPSLLKVDFDDTDAYELSSCITGDWKKAFIIIDLLNEVYDPRKLITTLSLIANKDDALIYISPERSSQKNRDVLGPPTCNYRLREWTQSELSNFLADTDKKYKYEISIAHQNANNYRLDLVAYSTNISANIADCLNNKDALELAPENINKFNFENSSFSFDIMFSKKRNNICHGILNYLNIEEVENELMFRIENEIPTSLIRVGHAEIRLLGFPDFVHPVWASRSLNVCFGDSIVSASYSQLKVDMLDSFIHSDYIGVPKPQESDQHWRHAIPLLSFNGCNLANKKLHSQNIHLELLRSGFFDRLLSNADELLLIGCRDLRNKICKKYNIKNVEWIAIPGEAKFVDNQELHYPNKYLSIKDEIQAKYKKLVLVGAGLPGNSYCHWAKQLGAVAIDIGSVMDIWDNEETRTSFNKYAKYAL